MKLRRRIAAVLLALLLSVFPHLSAAAADIGETQRMVLTFEENADPNTLFTQLDSLSDVTVLHRYDLLFEGAAVECGAATAEKLADLPGIDAVIPTHSYSRPQAISDPLLESNSLSLMNGTDLTYTGDGMVIAVLDSGLRYTHEAFAENDLTTAPAISREDSIRFSKESGIPGRYLSQRIPFAFDYADGDGEVFTTDTHGTHVSALAVGYAKDADGAVKFRGTAPAAQLLSMKVFHDRASAGANDADILKALEDAAALGADVICLSLGVDNGFSEDYALDGLYSQIFSDLRKSGVIICCAAGNTTTAVSSKPEGTALPTTDYTDYGTLSSPASYPGAVAVSAAQTNVWQSAGYLQVGEEQIPFTRAASEQGLALPALDTLSGGTYPLVPIPGIGTAADYAGLDVRGKIVLVQRGTISFTEKVQNAAAAGATACLVRNNATDSITPIVECSDIPCALISLEDGADLMEQSISSLTVRADAFVERREGNISMLMDSAWGPTGDLRITPTITAPGDTILSASAAGNDLYEQLSGTSMAAPNASGAFALVLEKLYESGLEAGAETADLAQALLCSTANVMTTEEGIPLSPRRQGAGLIDLSAALSAPAVITDPLLEVGESASGRFTLTFQVKNLTDQPVDFTVTPTVLTEDWTEKGNQTYSLLTPLDITDQVTVTGPDKISIPASGERSVTLTLTVSPTLRQQLSQVYTNGFFTEGYITLTNDTGRPIHTTFLGYCGDWEKAPVLEQTDFRDVMNAEATGEVLPESNMGVNLVHISGSTYAAEDAPLLGQNPYLTAPYREDRFAISSLQSSALHSSGGLFTTELYTLRNARRLIMVVSDRNGGSIHHVTDIPWLTKSTLNTITGGMGSVCSLWWNGTDSAGNPLPDSSRVQVRFYAWPESDSTMTAAYDNSQCSSEDPNSYRWLISGAYERCLEWTFPVTIDRAAPTVTAANTADHRLTLSVKDQQYLAYLTVKDSAGNILAEEHFADERSGVTHTLQVDSPVPSTLYITAADYAGNTTACTVDTETLTVEPCIMLLLKDVDRDAWYHNAVDYIRSMGVMTETDPLTFNPHDIATRADLIQALYQIAGSPEMEYAELPFTDIAGGTSYRSALQWAYGKGLVTGYSDTLFAAFAGISRQQLATVLYRLAQQSGEIPTADTAVLTRFTDSARISPWAAEAMAWAVEAGIFSGDCAGALTPTRSATRAELAQVLMNYLEQ